MRAHGAPAEKKLRAVEGSDRYEMETRIVAAAALGKIMGGLYDAPKRIREIRDAEKQRQKEHWNRLTRRYERFTSKLPDVTRIELSAISMVTNGLPSSMKRQTFPIRPYNEEARVHSQTNLVGTDALEIARAWRKQHFSLLEHSIL